MRAFRPLPVLDRYFDRMLALLAARGIPTDFIAMPMNRSHPGRGTAGGAGGIRPLPGGAMRRAIRTSTWWGR